ncbi:MAG: enoyl-CoA hydratase/carnithine racemase [Parasphingorhabdus sp.]|jgi:enoyl-CoA hydratase/carnithine racemase
MTTDRVHYEKRGQSAWITLNRPEALNAVTPQMIESLHHFASEAQDDPDVRVIVITGTGRGFCPGFDIALFQELSTNMNELWGVAENLLTTWSFIRTLSKPTIAALNGVTAGGGFELALGCDLRIASRTAKIGSCEVGINQPTTNGSSYMLARLIGESKAKELCFTGDLWSAEEAARVGLVNAVADPDEFEGTVQNWADKISSRAPIAVRAVKDFFEKGRLMSIDSVVEMEEKAALACCFTEDQQEGFNAFLEKREPRWADK